MTEFDPMNPQWAVGQVNWETRREAVLWQSAYRSLLEKEDALLLARTYYKRDLETCEAVRAAEAEKEWQARQALIQKAKRPARRRDARAARDCASGYPAPPPA